MTVSHSIPISVTGPRTILQQIRSMFCTTAIIRASLLRPSSRLHQPRQASIPSMMQPTRSQTSSTRRSPTSLTCIERIAPPPGSSCTTAASYRAAHIVTDERSLVTECRPNRDLAIIRKAGYRFFKKLYGLGRQTRLPKVDAELGIVAPHHFAGLRLPVRHDELKYRRDSRSGLHQNTCADLRNVADRARHLPASENDRTGFIESPAMYSPMIGHGPRGRDDGDRTYSIAIPGLPRPEAILQYLGCRPLAHDR